MKQILLIPRSLLKPTMYALVDDENFDFLNKFSWYPWKVKRTYYARAHVSGKTIFMHQLVLPCVGNTTPDHKNSNGLDNQLANLRVATAQQQAQNMSKRKGCSSQYKGVQRYRNGKWQAYITCKGITQGLGYFYTEREAALAYNKAAQEIFGEFAKLNGVVE